MKFLVAIFAVSALVGVCMADGYGKPAYPAAPVAHHYAAHAPHVKCGANLLVGCAPHVAHVPCHPVHGGHAKKEYGHAAPAYHHAPAPAYHHAPAPAYHHAPAPAHHGGYEAPKAHGYEAPKAHGYEAPKAHGYEAPKAHGYEAPKAHAYGGYGKRSSDFEAAAEMED
uniref:Putative secreted protein n=1 Tax=Anopheles darlingi TaxID=43151 RepID=A0A2M4CJK9_ANODA